jgi:hypothetical protein
MDTILSEEQVEKTREIIEVLSDAMERISDIRDEVTDILWGTDIVSNYNAYGKYGFDTLLGEGNPYDDGIPSMIEHFKKMLKDNHVDHVEENSLSHRTAFMPEAQEDLEPYVFTCPDGTEKTIIFEEWKKGGWNKKQVLEMLDTYPLEDLANFIEENQTPEKPKKGTMKKLPFHLANVSK